MAILSHVRVHAVNEHLPSADPDRTNLRVLSAGPVTTDATADATNPRLAGWMDELRGMMGGRAS
jgi:hypothetical protein